MGSAFLSKLQTHAPVAQPQVMSSGAAKEAGDLPQEQGVASDAEDQLSADAQDGVRKIQATTRVWSKGHLIFAYVMYILSSLSPISVFSNTRVNNRLRVGHG